MDDKINTKYFQNRDHINVGGIGIGDPDKSLLATAAADVGKKT